MILVLVQVVFGCLGYSAEGGGAAALVSSGAETRLKMQYNGVEIISPEGPALVADTVCQTAITMEKIPDGCLIKVAIKNPLAHAVEMPKITLGGITFAAPGAEIVDNWKLIGFSKLTAGQKTGFSWSRTYPGTSYSPVLGIRSGDIFVGAALMYNVLEVKKDVRTNYAMDKAGRWSMIFEPAGPVKTDNPAGEGTKKTQTPAMLDPGQTLTLTLSVCAVKSDVWLDSYRAYRDFFKKTYGGVRYKASREPIFATSMGGGRYITDENPRGYSPNSAGGGARKGRLDLEGWDGFGDYITSKIRPLGYGRVMIWTVPGTYRKHRNTTMAWEIGTGFSGKMVETEGELAKLRDGGFAVGFWWGRAVSVSGGFDSGIRRAFDPDNPADRAAVFNELDPTYRRGVRLIGCDATSRSAYASEWKPSVVTLFEKWFPLLYERYPEMKWMVEPAATDILHVWGSSYIYDRDIHGPNEFAEFILPGQETNAVMTVGFAEMTQERLDQLLKWGYIPMVFANAGAPLKIDRELIRK